MPHSQTPPTIQGRNSAMARARAWKAARKKAAKAVARMTKLAPRRASKSVLSGMLGVYQATTMFWVTKETATSSGIDAGTAMATIAVITKLAATPKTVETAKLETERMTTSTAMPA